MYFRMCGRYMAGPPAPAIQVTFGTAASPVIASQRFS